jgi:hypothetical protein
VAVVLYDTVAIGLLYFVVLLLTAIVAIMVMVFRR